MIEPTVDEQGPEESEAPDGAPQVTTDPAPGPRLFGVIVAIVAAVVVLDQLSKGWAVGALGDGHVVDVVGPLRFSLAYNTGTAFSIGSGKGLGPWISVLAIVVVVGLSLGYTSRFRLGAVAAGMIAGGAIGNLADRAFRGDEGFLHGGVVDFIKVEWWPVFNIADSAISVGAVLLVIASLRAPAPAPTP
ncbi:MAG: lspA [Acidimicrobiales bacterium]|nr:lspA [Acidimicrobiales bacterium]